MNCDVCQRRLLATAAPEVPTREVRRHLARCPACRAFQRRLTRIEGNVPALPVPPSRGKERFLARFLGPREHVPNPSPHPLPREGRGPGKGVLRVAWATAAAVLIGCGVYLGIWLAESVAPLAPPNQPVAKTEPELPDQDLVARLVDCDLRLAEHATPRKRVEALAELADALQRESHALSRGDGADELQALARLYGRVIEEGMVPRAREMPARERREVLAPIAARLSKAENEARQLAAKSARASAPLLQIAAAAGAGDRKSRGLMEEVQ
jgi:hypothetical protein